MSSEKTYRPLKELQSQVGIVLCVGAAILCLACGDALYNILPLVEIDSQFAGTGDFVLGLVMGAVGLFLLLRSGR